MRLKDFIEVEHGEVQIAELDKQFILDLLDALKSCGPSEKRDELIQQVVAYAAFPPVFMVGGVKPDRGL